MPSMIRPRPTLIAAAAAALLASAGAAAQQAPATTSAPAAPASTEAKKPQIQSIEVTAERRVASIQKTAISIVALDGEEIAEQGLTNAADLLKNVTGVEVQGAARGNVLAIRGIGSDLPPGMGESAVSTNFDGLYNFRAEANTIGLFDLERVEVLRGPQGTLYGRSAAGGVGNFISRGPEIGKAGGNYTLELGTYGLIRAEGGVNVPVNSMLALRVAGTTINRDGYLSDSFNDDVASAVRVKLLFKPSSSLSVLFGLEKDRLGGKGPGFIPQANWDNADTRLQSAVNPTTPGLEKAGYQKYRQTKTWIQLDTDLGFGVLTVMPAWQRADGELYRAYDASRPPGSEVQYNLDPQNAKQDSLEVRLASPERSALKWVLGYYGYKMATGVYCFVSCAPAAFVANPNTAGTDSKSLFGQVTVPVSAQLRIIGGLRRTTDDKRASNAAGPDFTDTWKNTDGKAGVEFDAAPAVMAYATYATSHRPGGFNGLPFAVPPLRFEAEKLKSFELGIKSQFLDNTVQVNAALFSLDYENYQAVDFAPPVYSSITNVPKQKMRGFELDSRVLLGAGSLRASLALLDAKLGSYTLVSTGADISGNPMPHAPKTTIKLGYEYPIDLAGGASLTLRADARHVSQQYVSFTENANTLQPAYGTGDLSAVYASANGKWSLTAYVKNVNDYVVKTSNFGGYTQVGAPRTAGLILNSRF